MISSATVVNVASVPMRSPFRYPGGKTWLVPRVRQWLKSLPYDVSEFVEPFAGGAIVGLTVAFEQLAQHVTLIEMDADVASVWQTILSDNASQLVDQIVSFDLTAESTAFLADPSRRTVQEQAFATIVRNRISRGGILAPGAGVVKQGENGRGLLSRWYPETLRQRIMAISAIRDRIAFLREDGIGVLAEFADDARAAIFIDPPYTVAGRRLYAHSDIDHPALFRAASALRGSFLMTYDDTPEIQSLAAEHGFQTGTVPMKSTHHAVKLELLISRDLSWLERERGAS